MHRKHIIWAAVILVVTIAGLILYSRRKAASSADSPRELSRDPNIVELNEQSRRSINLKVAEVAERQLLRTVTATGVVGADQSRVAHVFPLARGIVERVDVQLGDRVRGGQPLLEYDNIELGQLIGEFLKLKGDLERIEAQQQVAQKVFDRARALVQVEGISRQELELRQAEYQQATAAVEAQRADASRVEEQLHRFGMDDQQIGALGQSPHGTHRTATHNTLRAPFSGIITKYDVSPREVVDREKELFTIVDTSTVWVQADVYEKDLGSVRSGGKALIRVASYPSETFTGTITYISDFLDPASRTAKIRCVVANTDGRLKLEMFATVEIPTVESRTALTVPASALQQVDSDTVVFVERDPTHFEKRVVQVGEHNNEWIEVLSGVRKGEQVVTGGSFSLKSILLRELIGGEG